MRTQPPRNVPARSRNLLSEAVKQAEDIKQAEQNANKDTKDKKSSKPNGALFVPDMPKRSAKYVDDSRQTDASQPQKHSGDFDSVVSTTNAHADADHKTVTSERNQVETEKFDQKKDGDSDVELANPLFLPVTASMNSTGAKGLPMPSVGSSAEGSGSRTPESNSDLSVNGSETFDNGYESSGADDIYSSGRSRTGTARQLYGSQKSARALRSIDLNRPRESMYIYIYIYIYIHMYVCIYVYPELVTKEKRAC
jgi:hypothetical protein